MEITTNHQNTTYQGYSLSKDSFEHFYKQNFRRIYYYFHSKGVRTEEASELAQDTFLKIFKGWEDFRGETSLNRWADVVAKSIWCNYLRDKKTQKRDMSELSLELDEGERQIEERREVSPHENALQEEYRAKLIKAIHELPKRTRQVVMLRIYHDLKFSEIADLLKTSEDTVKSQMSQGKRKLKDIFHRLFPDDMDKEV